MKRKSALATAAAITGTMFAAGAATALNSAILGGGADASPGGAPSILATASGDQLVESPTTITAAPAEAESPATIATLPPVRSPGAEPVSISAGSSVGSGGGEYDDDDREHEEHEHEHEYEGSDDDD